MRDGGVTAPSRVFARGALTGSMAVVLAVAIVMAGAPAREPAVAAESPADALAGVEVDPTTLPVVTADEEVATLNTDVDLDAIALTLAENLVVEGEAVMARDSTTLPAVDGGRRLRQMIGRVDDAVATGVVGVPHYDFDSLHAIVIPAIGGQEATLGLETRGEVETVVYDAGGMEQSRHSEPLVTTFVLSPVTGDRWLIIEERPGS